jgi:hypothetical protein
VLNTQVFVTKLNSNTNIPVRKRASLLRKLSVLSCLFKLTGNPRNLSNITHTPLQIFPQNVPKKRSYRIHYNITYIYLDNSVYYRTYYPTPSVTEYLKYYPAIQSILCAFLRLSYEYRTKYFTEYPTVSCKVSSVASYSNPTVPCRVSYRESCSVSYCVLYSILSTIL